MRSSPAAGSPEDGMALLEWDVAMVDERLDAGCSEGCLGGCSRRHRLDKHERLVQGLGSPHVTHDRVLESSGSLRGECSYNPT